MTSSDIEKKYSVRIMRYIKKKNKPILQNELAEKLNIHPSTISSETCYLEKVGLIKKYWGNRFWKGKGKIIEITGGGLTALEELDKDETT